MNVQSTIPHFPISNKGFHPHPPQPHERPFLQNHLFVYTIVDNKVSSWHDGGRFVMPIPPKYHPKIASDGKQPTEHSVRVSVTEASRLFGVNPRTIRRAITANELRYIVSQGRYKIHFSSLVQWSQKSTIQHKRDTHGIGQWIDQWKMKNTKFSPRAPGA